MASCRYPAAGEVSEHIMFRIVQFSFYNFGSHIYVYFDPKHVLVLKSDLKNLTFSIFIEVISFHFYIGDFSSLEFLKL